MFKWSTRSLNRGKIMVIQLSPSSWWPKPRRDEPDGSIIPRSRKKKIRDRPTAKKAVKFNLWRVKNPDLNKIKRKFLRRQKFSFYFGASTVRTTLNSTLIRLLLESFYFSFYFPPFCLMFENVIFARV